MQIEERLKELKDKINDKVPHGINVTQVEFEGPELVIYTDDPKRFADEADLIKILARDLRKRIVVRPTILEDPEKAYNDIKAVVPETAGITDIFFDADTGEVLIEAEKPGVVIGKNGTTLREITTAIGWTPKVVRTPPIESSTVKQVRQYLRSVERGAQAVPPHHRPAGSTGTSRGRETRPHGRTSGSGSRRSAAAAKSAGPRSSSRPRTARC